MNLLVMLIMGGIVGWLAGVIMRTRGGLLVDVVVGMLGALLAGYLFGRATLISGAFDLVSLLWSLLGAIILLAVVKLFSRR
ncbi:MAG: GlsB/YeaQ/YmgE family stress response membrane protein [Anaerolineae bacterium]|jgi:uncharacterized membrane protein YeaQ/YmgE (transglycosylase-associated protein family)|nr:GlsB/YeaQ/YmgE family stress response membrane protein [Anaerolineae bacterium]